MAYQHKKPPLDACPVEEVIALVGGRWKARILDALRRSPLGLSVLQRRLPGVSQQVLITQLHGLIADGLVDRGVKDERPVFRLTEDGRDLTGMLDIVAAWGIRRLARRGVVWSGSGEPSRVPEASI